MSAVELNWQGGSLSSGEMNWFVAFALDAYFIRYLMAETLPEDFAEQAGCRYCPAIQIGGVRHYVNYVSRSPVDSSSGENKQIIKIGCTGMDVAVSHGHLPPCAAGLELGTWQVLLEKYKNFKPFDYVGYDVIDA